MEFKCPTALGENRYKICSPACQSLQSCNFDKNLVYISRDTVQLTSAGSLITCVLRVCCNCYYHQFIGKTHSLENIDMEIISLDKTGKKNERFFLSALIHRWKILISFLGNWS